MKKVLHLSCTIIMSLLVLYATYELCHHAIEVTDAWKGWLLTFFVITVLFVTHNRYGYVIERYALYIGSFAHTLVHSYAVGVSLKEGFGVWCAMVLVFLLEESLRIYAMTKTLSLSKAILVIGSLCMVAMGTLGVFTEHDFGKYEWTNIAFYSVLIVIVLMHLFQHKKVHV